MHMGLGVLRLSPRDFWQSTPREIAVAFAVEHLTPLSRDEFDGLMQRFPDVT